MNSFYHAQNIALLIVACLLAVLWESGWPFLLLVFWTYEK